MPQRWLGFEQLEFRDVPTAGYTLQSIVSSSHSSTSEFRRFGDLVSISNQASSPGEYTTEAGTVAFVGYSDFNGDQTLESGLWMLQSGQVLRNVNPEFSDTNGRDFGRAVDINDTGTLSARDLVGSTAQGFVRTWSVTDADEHTNIATVNNLHEAHDPDHLRFSVLQTFTDINDRGDVAFVGTAPDGETRSLVVSLAADGKHRALDTYAVMGASSVPRPQLTSDGRVLFRGSDGQLKLVNPVDGSEIVVSRGFKSVGYASGITKDGRLVSFIGDNGDGPGVYLAYRSGGAYKTVRVAGTEDGWSEFDLTDAVRVNNTLLTERGVTVAFEAKHETLGHGIYTARVSFLDRQGPVAFNPDRAVPIVHGALPVVLVGEQYFSNPAKTFVDFEFWNGINDRRNGEIAFWAKHADGTEAVIRAIPKPIIHLQFNPVGFDVVTDTFSNMFLLTEYGATSGGLGWHDNFAAAMNRVGLPGMASAQNDIVSAVQSYLDRATDNGRILVVGRVGEAAPAFVPWSGLHPDGKSITAGAYQTILIGGLPQTDLDTDRGEYGKAAPVNVALGALDYFNQVRDDLGMVFADRIVTGAFSNPHTAPYSALVQSIASITAHEIGHNFGLFHLDTTDPDATDEIMRGGTDQDSHLSIGAGFSDSSFSIRREPVAGLDGTLYSPGEERPAARLNFAIANIGTIGPIDPPDAAVLVVPAKYSLRSSLPFTPNGNGPTTAKLVLGVRNANSGETLPVFEPLGEGNLAALLAAARVPSGPGTELLLFGSTDGTRMDIIGVPNGETVDLTALSYTPLGLTSDARLRNRVGPGTGNPGFQLYYRPESGAPVLMGSVAVQGVPEAGVLVDGAALATGGVLGMGETTPGGGALTRTITVRNTGSAALSLGTVAVVGAGYTVTQPAQTTLAAGAETTFTVRLSDATAGAGLTGTLTIPSNDPAGAFTLTLRGSVDPTPRVLSVTRLDNGTGPLRIQIEFSAPLDAGSAQVAASFAIASDSDAGLRIASAAYQTVGGRGRVTLTGPDAATLPSGNYRVRIAGDKVKGANGALLTSGASNLMVDVAVSEAGTTIGATADGSLGMIAGPTPWINGRANTVDLADFNGDGLLDLVTVGDDPFQVTPRYNITLFLALPEGGYDSPMAIEIFDPALGMGLYPQRVLAADWDQNGTPDILIAEQTFDGLQRSQVRILLNDGTGTFTQSEPPILLNSVGGYWPQTLTVADFTGDGKNDLAMDGATESPAQSRISVFTKDPFLGYSRAFDLAQPSSQHQAYKISTADFNNDGKADLVVGQIGPGQPQILTYMSGPNGYGAFVRLEYENERYGGYFEVGDFTGDGKPDVLVYHDGNVVTVVAGDGQGNLTQVSRHEIDRYSAAIVASGDIDGDGDRDFVLMAEPESRPSYPPVPERSLIVVRNDGGGRFVPGELRPIGASGVTAFGNFVLADGTGDGAPDLYFGNTLTGQIGIAVNDAAGSFRVVSGVGPNLGSPVRGMDRAESALASADINRDGLPDYVRAGASGIDVYLGQPDGTYGLVSTVGTEALYVRLGDLNNDGLPDLVTSSFNDRVPNVYLGDGNGRFTRSTAAPPELPDGFYMVSTGVLSDANTDGKLDFVATLSVSSGFGVAPDAFAVFFGDGTGRLITNVNTIYRPGGYLDYVYTPPPSVFDVTGDGKPDLITGVNDGFSPSLLTVHRGNGNGTFTALASVARPQDDTSVRFVPGDFTGDGVIDLLGHTSEGGYLPIIRFYRGTGPGQFVHDPTRDLVTEVGFTHLTATDLTGDGILDLAYVNRSFFYDQMTDYIFVRVGLSGGGFGPETQVPVGGLGAMGLLPMSRGGSFEAGSFTVTAPPPVIIGGNPNLSVTTNEGRSVTIDPRTRVTVVPGTPLSLAVGTLPTHGTIEIDVFGTPTNTTDDRIVYTPAAGYAGADSFTYILADDLGNRVTGTVNITVAQLPTIAFSTTTYSVNASTSFSVSIPLARSGPAGAAVSGQVLIGGGSATPGLDYVAGPYPFTFGPNETTTSVDVFVYNGGSSVTAGLTVVTADGARPGSPAAATLSIHPGTPTNTNPTISDVTNRTLPPGGSTGAIAFTVGDAETPVGSLLVTATSSNQTLVPFTNVSVAGIGANRTVTVTAVAGQTGTTTITLSVNDVDGGIATDTFTVTVSAGNQQPTISNVSNRTIPVNGNSGAISFTIGDFETPAGSLNVTASSSNLTLVPNANIVLGGSGANRTVTVTPATNQTGTATITLTVNDGNGGIATDTFLVTVSQTPPAPTLPADLIVTGPGGGFGVRYSANGGQYDGGQLVALMPGYGGELHAALGDVTGDGVLDTVVGTGPGSDMIRVLDGANGSVLAQFNAFGGYGGGVFVAVGDLNGDGKADVAVTPDAVDAFSGPVPDQLPVRVFSGASIASGNPVLLAAFDGLASLSGQSGQNNPLVRLGGRPAIADMNGDGFPDLLVAAGSGGGPRVTVWDGRGFANANGGRPTHNPIANLFVFESTQRGGAFLAAGDVNGDGKAEIAVGGGPSGGPRVRIVNPTILLALPNLEGVNLDSPENLSNGLVLNNFFAGNLNNRGGVRITMRDVDGDGRAEVVTGSGTGEYSQVRIYFDEELNAAAGSSSEPANVKGLDPFGGFIPGGIWVG